MHIYAYVYTQKSEFDTNCHCSINDIHIFCYLQNFKSFVGDRNIARLPEFDIIMPSKSEVTIRFIQYFKVLSEINLGNISN